ncbi:hypothetical protein [Bacillus sp. EB106-08-02-XG196]|jgi:hypothetical protein|nr:hypothetical protein [Bacillus sp. EB106-08-02-XG196]
MAKSGEKSFVKGKVCADSGAFDIRANLTPMLIKPNKKSPMI